VCERRWQRLGIAEMWVVLCERKLRISSLSIEVVVSRLGDHEAAEVLSAGVRRCRIGVLGRLVAVETTPKRSSPPFLICAPSHHDEIAQFQCNTQNHRIIIAANI